MSDKKYQIFISSTYKDLVEAREKTIETILSMYHFPIGMEMFSAADDNQWQVIKETIDQSDYYVIIIGDRYGSETSEGISYTEKEYDYAKSKRIPILAFIRDRNVATKPEERDNEAEKIEKLNKFISKAEANKMRDTWTTIDDLGGKVAIALTKTFGKKPGIGWIREDNKCSLGIISESKKELGLNLETIFDNRFIQCTLRQVLRDEYDKFLNRMIRRNFAFYSEKEQIYTITGGVPGLFTVMEGIFQFEKNGHIYVAFLDNAGIKYYTNDEQYFQRIPANSEMQKWITKQGFDKLIYFGSVPTDKLKAISGEYILHINRVSRSKINIKVKDNNEVEFSGGANNGGNVGKVYGTMKLIDGYLSLYQDLQGNKLKFVFFGDKINIYEQGSFGGLNVSFRGEYDRVVDSH